jgi:hypothetical protein
MATATDYIALPDHPGRNTSGCVKEMVRLDKMLTEYSLPMVNLHFYENKKLIGIEVLV